MVQAIWTGELKIKVAKKKVNWKLSASRHSINIYHREQRANDRIHNQTKKYISLIYPLGLWAQTKWILYVKICKKQFSGSYMINQCVNHRQPNKGLSIYIYLPVCNPENSAQNTSTKDFAISYKGVEFKTRSKQLI